MSFCWLHIYFIEQLLTLQNSQTDDKEGQSTAATFNTCTFYLVKSAIVQHCSYVLLVLYCFPLTNTCPHRYIQLVLSPWEQDADSSTENSENSLLLTVFKFFFDNTAKKKNQN